MTVIQKLKHEAASIRAMLPNPSPGVYNVKCYDLLSSLLRSSTDDELREAVRLLSRAPVHQLAHRDSLLETLVTHFQHMTNHQKNLVTGKPY